MVAGDYPATYALVPNQVYFPGDPWDAASYSGVGRLHVSPIWEHAQAVGNTTRATLRLSKDNVILAYRAVDGQGHRSLPAVPLPAR